LSFAISKGANYWSSLCAWHVSAEKMMSTFGRQALSMTWDYTEANPFSDSSGNFTLGVTQAAEFLEKLIIDITPGQAVQRDVGQLATSSSFIISTDPPYYDNIGYADLADFFYVWLRKGIGRIYSELFSTLLTPKENELIADPARHPTSEAASQFFEHGLFKAFDRIHDATSVSYPTSIFYAFKQSETVADEATASTGWETFLSGAVGGGFQILGTWPIRTEQAAGLRLLGRNSLASPIVLVCRPRSEDAPTISRRQFVDALRRELPAALREMQSGNIAPVDLAQASIGPGMAIYSRYSKVLEADDSPMSVRTALGLINQELDAYLAEQDGDIDADTRFAIAWFEQFGFEEGEFRRADVLARAKNTSVEGVVRAGVVKAEKGKVKLIHWKHYDPGMWNPTEDSRPTVWEAVHHLIERLTHYGEPGSALLMTKMSPDMAAGRTTSPTGCTASARAKGGRNTHAITTRWSSHGQKSGRKPPNCANRQRRTTARSRWGCLTNERGSDDGIFPASRTLRVSSEPGRADCQKQAQRMAHGFARHWGLRPVYGRRGASGDLSRWFAGKRARVSIAGIVDGDTRNRRCSCDQLFPLANTPLLPRGRDAAWKHPRSGRAFVPKRWVSRFGSVSLHLARRR
jgi:putative DNA methylase